MSYDWISSCIYIYVVNVYCARVFVEYLGGSFEEVKKEYEG